MSGEFGNALVTWVARRGGCLRRRLARHCNMVTQQRDHATRLGEHAKYVHSVTMPPLAAEVKS